MPIRITDIEGGWELEVPLAGATLEALRLQIAKLQKREIFLDPVCARIGERISEAVVEVLDPDLRPPTEAQVKFALDIARELGVNLPGEALQYRGTMHNFLQRFSQQFYERRNKRMY